MWSSEAATTTRPKPEAASMVVFMYLRRRYQAPVFTAAALRCCAVMTSHTSTCLFLRIPVGLKITVALLWSHNDCGAEHWRLVRVHALFYVLSLAWPRPLVLYVRYLLRILPGCLSPSFMCKKYVISYMPMSSCCLCTFFLLPVCVLVARLLLVEYNNVLCLYVCNKTDVEF